MASVAALKARLEQQNTNIGKIAGGKQESSAPAPPKPSPGNKPGVPAANNSSVPKPGLPSRPAKPLPVKPGVGGASRPPAPDKGGAKPPTNAKPTLPTKQPPIGAKPLFGARPAGGASDAPAQPRLSEIERKKVPPKPYNIQVRGNLKQNAVPDPSSSPAPPPASSAPSKQDLRPALKPVQPAAPNKLPGLRSNNNDIDKNKNEQGENKPPTSALWTAAKISNSIHKANEKDLEIYYEGEKLPLEIISSSGKRLKLKPFKPPNGPPPPKPSPLPQSVLKRGSESGSDDEYYDDTWPNRNGRPSSIIPSMTEEEEEILDRAGKNKPANGKKFIHKPLPPTPADDEEDEYYDDTGPQEEEIYELGDEAEDEDIYEDFD